MGGGEAPLRQSDRFERTIDYGFPVVVVHGRISTGDVNALEDIVLNLDGFNDIALHDIVLELATNQALNREQCVSRVGYRLALGRLTNQDLAVFGVADD